MTFTGSLGSKNKTELQDLATALNLSMEGTKPELTTRINAHFNENQDLKAHDRFIGLFSRRPQKRPVPIDNTASSDTVTATVPPPQCQRLDITAVNTPSLQHRRLDTVTAIAPPPQHQQLDTATNAPLLTPQVPNTLHPLIAMQHVAVPSYTLGSPITYSYYHTM